MLFNTVKKALFLSSTRQVRSQQRLLQGFAHNRATAEGGRGLWVACPCLAVHNVRTSPAGGQAAKNNIPADSSMPLTLITINGDGSLISVNKSPYAATEAVSVQVLRTHAH